MVIFTNWGLSSVIPRSTCGLAMAGEDTGLEAMASPMVGYLGKVQERATSLDHCPWCSSKGLTHHLRSYQLNLEESITLCTNPQCLFPLVSRPLEDILNSLVHVEPATESKKKRPLQIESQQTCSPSPKRLRLNEQDCPKSLANAPCEDSEAQNVVNSCNGQSAESQRLNLKDVLIITDANNLEETDTIVGDELDATDIQNVEIALDTGVADSSKSIKSDNHQVQSPQDDRKSEEHTCISTVEIDRDYNLPDGAVLPNKNTSLPDHSEAKGTTEDAETDNMSSTETNTAELVPVPTEIFWRNVHNLCWLDSLLVVLVKLKSLRKLKPKEDFKQSPVLKVIKGYDEACAAVQSQVQTDKDDVLKVPNYVLRETNGVLETHRMSIFKTLQPKLQCELGQNETPVFALPLLMKMDPWCEPLFQATFSWDFKCTACRSSSKQNVVKTLPTFTNIVPDWHPLRAVHLAPCNNCHRKNQRRKMVIQGLSPVFALHFVEGLPDNNIKVYSFSFNKKHYSVTAIIQYNSQHKHFVTWVQRANGSWVEFDDLKHPHCKSYETLPVPAQEIHIVFWEEDEEPQQESRACSPSTTFTESPPSADAVTHCVTDVVILEQDLMHCFPDQSLLNSQNDSDALDGVCEKETSEGAGVDTTIGSTTLLEAFEGLTHNDIITLTLVDINKDLQHPSGGQLEQADELKSQVLKDVTDKAMEDTPPPDSSSTVGPKENPEMTNSEQSSASDSEDNLSDDPTFEPKSNRGQKKSRAAAPKLTKTTKVVNPKGKGKVASKVALNAPVHPVESDCTPTANSKAPSPVLSIVSTPKDVKAPVVEQQNKGWSRLLTQSLGHMQNTTSKMNTTQKAVSQKPNGFTHSTPTPQMPPKAALKPVLRKEERGSLPLKAAEMYGAFGSKNTKTDTTINKTLLPVQKSISFNTVLNQSINTSDTTSLKKGKLSKMPHGLSETEALRYKLMKKLKAKKKKLAKLNEMLGQQGDATFIPDSTNMNSPNTVTSSTLDDDFFSDLLSPATTITSTLSPDSTDFLEMLANGQEASLGEEMASDPVVQQGTGAETAELLDEFMYQAQTERPTEMEAEAFSALDLFL